jgi:hypothetical protein
MIGLRLAQLDLLGNVPYTHGLKAIRNEISIPAMNASPKRQFSYFGPLKIEETLSLSLAIRELGARESTPSNSRSSVVLFPVGEDCVSNIGGDGRKMVLGAGADAELEGSDGEFRPRCFQDGAYEEVVFILAECFKGKVEGKYVAIGYLLWKLAREVVSEKELVEIFVVEVSSSPIDALYEDISEAGINDCDL